MRYFAAAAATLCCIFSPLVTAQESKAYNISVQYTLDGQFTHLPAWYGDGHIYVGPIVPASVKTALSFTVPNERSTNLYIESLDPANPLPNPTFLVVNDAPGASDPIFAVHDIVGLPETDVFQWMRYGAILFLMPAGASMQTHFFLEATDEPETYVIVWKAKGSDAGNGTMTTQTRGRRGKRAPALAGMSVRLSTIY